MSALDRALVGGERPAFTAPFEHQPRLAAAALFFFANFPPALLVGLGLAGRRCVNAGRYRLHRQCDHVDRSLGDRSDNAAGQSQKGKDGKDAHAPFLGQRQGFVDHGWTRFAARGTVPID